MRAVVQKVTHSSVTVDGEITGEIGQGLMVLLGVTHDDTETDAKYMAEKMCFFDKVRTCIISRKGTDFPYILHITLMYTKNHPCSSPYCTIFYEALKNA